jgi:hypothetical protein
LPCRAGEASGDRFERVSHAARIGDDGHVAAGAGDARFADGDDEIVELRNLEALAIEQLVLEEDHRRRIADRSLE